MHPKCSKCFELIQPIETQHVLFEKRWPGGKRKATRVCVPSLTCRYLSEWRHALDVADVLLFEVPTWHDCILHISHCPLMSQSVVHWFMSTTLCIISICSSIQTSSTSTTTAIIELFKLDLQICCAQAIYLQFFFFLLPFVSLVVRKVPWLGIAITIWIGQNAIFVSMIICNCWYNLLTWAKAYKHAHVDLVKWHSTCSVDRKKMEHLTRMCPYG